jgi:acetylglutamate/LysW-gamma-L-alpha-aminoadipate kinase
MIVIKTGGGGEITADAIVDRIADDLVVLQQSGERIVFVHGGNKALDDVATALGHPPEFVVSESGFTSRRTDRRTLEIFEMVYCGQLNKMWVEKLQQRGVNAVGLAGLDGRLLEGRRKDTLRVRQNGKRLVIRDDWTGTVERVNDGLLRLLLDHGYLPVVTPPAISDAGEAINVDGDRAAAAIAAAVGAQALVFLTDVPGILERFPDPESLIARVPRSEVERLVELVAGRMKKKVLGAGAAIDDGVGKVVIAQGTAERPIQTALAGGGTHFIAP